MDPQPAGRSDKALALSESLFSFERSTRVGLLLFDNREKIPRSNQSKSSKHLELVESGWRKDIKLWLSYEEQSVDALASRGDERRGKLR